VSWAICHHPLEKTYTSDAPTQRNIEKHIGEFFGMRVGAHDQHFTYVGNGPHANGDSVMEGRAFHPMNASVQTASTNQLCSALENSLANHFGVPRGIVRLERHPSAFRSSFALKELDVELDDGTTLQLMFKDLSWRSLLPDAQRSKPAFLYNPLREIEVYRNILATNQLSVATFYGAAVDRQADCYWLFLEKVPGMRLSKMGEFAIWEQVGRWLAIMHAHFAEESGTLTQRQAAPVIQYDGDFYRLWLRRAQAFLRQAERSQLGITRRGVEWLAGRYNQIIERLVVLPTTFIHGEFYAANVLVQETAGELCVCPVDWEMAAVGPGLMDLAALIAGKWTEEEKVTLALAYYHVLAPDSRWCSSPEVFLAALECCRLHLAVQWLGWSPDWSPSASHAQDWLGEVLFLAEKLGL
jgi:Ser/Thr protein kinase RdoA (MazF antagonist)